MHDLEIQNWLNHARSIGYSDTEIRKLMLKAGWSFQQVNHVMTTRGLTPGSGNPTPKGKVIPRRIEAHGKALARHYSTVAILITVSIAVWVIVYWAWQQ